MFSMPIETMYGMHYHVNKQISVNIEICDEHNYAPVVMQLGSATRHRKEKKAETKVGQSPDSDSRSRLHFFCPSV
jgi:hypothetical protein